MKPSKVYEKRYYREYLNENLLLSYNVTVFETDLQIYCDVDLKDEIEKTVKNIRKNLMDYIDRHPEFNRSLLPIKIFPEDSEFIKHMKRASRSLNIGPMATVAGAVAHYVGECHKSECSTLIIENGGDIYVNSDKDRVILIHSGDSKFKNKLKIKIEKEKFPLGICTSSGKMGHSLSFGNSDAVVILAKDTLLADATATAVGNFINSSDDIDKGIDFIKKTNGIEGGIIIVEDVMGAWGNIKFID